MSLFFGLEVDVSKERMSLFWGEFNKRSIVVDSGTRLTPGWQLVVPDQVVAAEDLAIGLCKVGDDISFGVREVAWIDGQVLTITLLVLSWSLPILVQRKSDRYLPSVGSVYSHFCVLPGVIWPNSLTSDLSNDIAGQPPPTSNEDVVMNVGTRTEWPRRPSLIARNCPWRSQSRACLRLWRAG